MFGPSPGHATIVSLSAAMSNSVQGPCAVFGLHTCVLVVVLAACLGFCELAHCHGKPWDETQAGEEAVPTMGGSTVVFCQLALEWPELGVETPT
jgi:hypothetical protein